MEWFALNVGYQFTAGLCRLCEQELEPVAVTSLERCGCVVELLLLWKDIRAQPLKSLTALSSGKAA